MPKILTPRCIVCGQTTVIEVTFDEWGALHSNRLIQNALPNRDANFRELVMTGTHNGCWMTMHFQTEDAQDEFQEFLDGLTLLIYGRDPFYSRMQGNEGMVL